MSPKQLASLIESLSAVCPFTNELEAALIQRGIWSKENVWYATQKQHWLGWLAEYSGPGFYGRTNWQRDARFVYNHIVCPPMILWLPESAGVETTLIQQAMHSALSCVPVLATQSASIRRCIPWELIHCILVDSPV